MELSEILKESCISFDVDLSTKEAVFDYLINQFYQVGIIDSKEAFKQAVYHREGLSETGLSEGIAIPHGVDQSVHIAAIAYVRLLHPITWESIDNQPVKHIFLLAIPCKGDDTHIRMISQLARSLIKKEVIEQINHAKAASDLLCVI